jgi:hypothetical protein
LLEKGCVQTEFQRQRAPQAGAHRAHQFAHEALRSLGVVEVAGTVLAPQDLPGLSQMGQPRVVTGVLGLMGVEAAHRPGDLVASAHHGAVEVAAALDRARRCGGRTITQSLLATAVLGTSHLLLTAHTRNF